MTGKQDFGLFGTGGSRRKNSYPKLLPSRSIWDSREKTRDEHRSFKKSQKAVQWDKQKGRCAKCRNKLEQSHVQYHHKYDWAKGGKTTTKNCIAVCANCHQKIHTLEKAKKADRKSEKPRTQEYGLGLNLYGVSRRQKNPFF